jgi:hypothetical protein
MGAVHMGGQKIHALFEEWACWLRGSIRKTLYNMKQYLIKESDGVLFNHEASDSIVLS